MNTVDYDFTSIVTAGRLTRDSSALDEMHLASSGLKADDIVALGNALGWDSKTIAHAIGTTTRALRQHNNIDKPLNLMFSERAIELAKLATIGIECFGSAYRWNQWLNTPNLQFDNQEPKAFIHSIRGRELLKRVMLGLEYGFTA